MWTIVQGAPNRASEANIGSQYRMNAQCSPAEGADAALDLQDLGSSRWQHAD